MHYSHARNCKCMHALAPGVGRCRRRRAPILRWHGDRQKPWSHDRHVCIDAALVECGSFVVGVWVIRRWSVDGCSFLLRHAWLTATPLSCIGIGSDGSYSVTFMNGETRPNVHVEQMRHGHSTLNMTPHASPTSTGWHPDYDGIAHRPYVESDNEGYVKGEEVWCHSLARRRACSSHAMLLCPRWFSDCRTTPPWSSARYA